MTDADKAREIGKALHALQWVEKHLTLTNEANAALHLNDKVFYSPLTGAVHEAVEGLSRVASALTDVART